MAHSIGLVDYGANMHAWVLDLPGCVTGGATLDEVATMLPLVIGEHADWLARHGGRDNVTTEWRVAETVDGTSLGAIGGEFAFASEREPLASPQLDSLIARMEFARHDLIEAVAATPQGLLDWTPPASTVRSFDDWAQGVRTIRDIAHHVLQLEDYYRSGLRDGETTGIVGRTGEPAAERARTLEVLRSFDDEARSRVYLPVRPSRSTAEEWTVRKLIRRVIAHERVHTAEIVQRRTWPLQGMPSYRGC